MTKLSISAVATTSALVWAGCVLALTAVNMAAPAYGTSVLHGLASIYPGFHADGSASAMLVGTVYALIDGGIGGCVFAWVYNRLTPAH
jgi:hypothetical protein